MKTIITTTILLLSLVFSHKIEAQISQVEIKAIGLTCSMCSNAINKQLKTLAEIIDIKTDLNNNSFTVNLKENNHLTPKIFKDLVEKAGFSVGQMMVNAKAESMEDRQYIVLNPELKTSGEVYFQVLDKGFVTDKEFKNLQKSWHETKSYALDNEADFHIKILAKP